MTSVATQSKRSRIASRCATPPPLFCVVVKLHAAAPMHTLPRAPSIPPCSPPAPPPCQKRHRRLSMSSPFVGGAACGEEEEEASTPTQGTGTGTGARPTGTAGDGPMAPKTPGPHLAGAGACASGWCPGTAVAAPPRVPVGWGGGALRHLLKIGLPFLTHHHHLCPPLPCAAVSPGFLATVECVHGAPWWGLLCCPVTHWQVYLALRAVPMVEPRARVPCPCPPQRPQGAWLPPPLPPLPSLGLALSPSSPPRD